MKRFVTVSVLFLTLVFVGLMTGASAIESYIVACTTGSAVSSPGSPAISCATNELVGSGPSDVVTGHVIVHGIGVVGGLVQIQAAVTTGPFQTVASTTCGSVLLTCEAATTQVGPPTNTFPTRYRAVCFWSGVIAVNTTVTCEMFFRPGQ